MNHAARLLLMAPILAAGLAACARHESGVKAIEAHVDGLTCPTCVPPLTKSLKRQYAASTVHVDDDKDTASVTFAGDDTFALGDFRAAVARVNMRVVDLTMRACGTVEETAGRRWLVAGQERFAVRSERDLPIGRPLCADGALDARSEPAVLQVTAFSLQ